MIRLADTDRVTLAVGEFTRRGVLWEHAGGMFLTGLLYLRDAMMGGFSHSLTYQPLTHVDGAVWAFALWPLLSALLLLLGLTGNRWRAAVAGLTGLAGWYLAQATLISVSWNHHGHQGLLGPVGVYSLVLLPKAVTHAIGIRATGRLSA